MGKGSVTDYKNAVTKSSTLYANLKKKTKEIFGKGSDSLWPELKAKLCQWSPEGAVREQESAPGSGRWGPRSAVSWGAS